MLEFFRRLFSPEPRSSETAKERLRLVLLSDHLSLAPEVVEALKRDLLEVISRYLEIVPALADVTFEQREREVAMLASIPIVGVRDRGAFQVASHDAREIETSGAANQSEAAYAGDEPQASIAAVEKESEEKPGPVSRGARRRRRKKAAALAKRLAAAGPEFELA